MSKTLKEKVEWICCTSVQDARTCLHYQDDINVIKAALEYEQAHMKRTTMVKMLEGKIRRMAKRRR